MLLVGTVVAMAMVSTLSLSSGLAHATSRSAAARSMRARPLVLSAQQAVIVGGGVSGLCNALELAGRGYEVTVLSRQRDEAATLAAGGMLAPQSERLEQGHMLDLAVAARDFFPSFAQALESASGVDIGLCASGGFFAPAFDGDVVHRWRPPSSGGAATWLDRPAAMGMEPLLSPEAVGGWWYPQDLSVDPRALHAALASACAVAGVHVREQAEAVALEFRSDGDGVRAVRLADGSLVPTPGHLILGNGAWLRELLPVPLQPIKGQMLCLTPPPRQAGATPSGGALRRVLFAESCYIIPRRDGRVVVGATVEPEAGFDTRPTAGGIHQVLSAAIRTVPALPRTEAPPPTVLQQLADSAAAAPSTPAAVGEDRGEQPYYDPNADVGSSIRSALRANRDFISKLEQGDEPKYGQTPPTQPASGASIAGSRSPGGSGDSTEGEAYDGVLPGEADGVRLWVQRGDELEPIEEGRPPAEFLAGYGDTVLPRPPPKGAPAAPAPPTLPSSSPRRKAGSAVGRGPAAPTLPTAADVPPPANGKTDAGFWGRVFRRSDEDAASAPSRPHNDEDPSSRPGRTSSGDWALPTIGSPSAPPPPASDDAIHSTDGYAELTAQDQTHATRDEAIRTARAANLALRQTVLEEEDDAALQALIDADLAKYRRGESPNI